MKRTTSKAIPKAAVKTSAKPASKTTAKTTARKRKTTARATQKSTQKTTRKTPSKTSSSATTSNAKQRLRLWIRMLRTTRSIEAELRERLRTEFGSTLPRFDVMAALSRHDHGIKMSELSRLLMVSNGNVTGIVERLAEEGLLLREADPGDRRAARVRLTRKGSNEFERQASAHQLWLDECLAGITAEESTTVTTLLAQATSEQSARTTS